MTAEQPTDKPGNKNADSEHNQQTNAGSGNNQLREIQSKLSHERGNNQQMLVAGITKKAKFKANLLLVGESVWEGGNPSKNNPLIL